MYKCKIPTGFLFSDKYTLGDLETLSIGDYGKAKNIRSPFLGFNREINGVPNGKIMPLSVKWVITISTQYGCSMRCKFCDVPLLKFRGNASFHDMMEQIKNALNMFPDIKYTDRLNIHFARMGEPLLNTEVLGLATDIHKNKAQFENITGKRFEVIHPVISTMCPRISHMERYIEQWVDIKNNLYNGQAGLQLSINSTDEKQREYMFEGNALPLKEISKILLNIMEPIGRKYTLNFALADDYILDGEYLAKLFDTNKWIVKITPIHKTKSSILNNIHTGKGYETFLPYKNAEESAINAGFDTIVFIPSLDEENNYVTCGNLLLKNKKKSK